MSNNGWKPRRKKDRHWFLWILMALVVGGSAFAIIGANVMKRHETKLANDQRAVEVVALPVPHDEPKVITLPRSGKIDHPFEKRRKLLWYMYEVEGMPCLWVQQTGMSCDWRKLNAKTKEEGADR